MIHHNIHKQKQTSNSPTKNNQGFIGLLHLSMAPEGERSFIAAESMALLRPCLKIGYPFAPMLAVFMVTATKSIKDIPEYPTFINCSISGSVTIETHQPKGIDCIDVFTVDRAI